MTEQDNIQQETLEDPVIASVEEPIEQAPAEEPSVDWETETKKFQSMYDKREAEFNKLQEDTKPLQELRKVLEERPDVVEAMKAKLSGGTAQEPKQSESLDENSFDPWEAYYKPDSASYKLRVGQEKKLVNEAVQEQFGQFQQQVAVDNLKKELASSYGMERAEDIDGFIEFATSPRDQLPLDLLVDVFRKHRGVQNQPQGGNIEAVQKAQQIPQSAGVLQGGSPTKKDPQKDVWKRVLNAGLGNQIP